MIGHDTFRRVDRWLGVPACAALTLLRRAYRFVRPSTASVGTAAPKHVLFVQLAESGSMVLADPALRALGAWTGARTCCVTFARNVGSLAITATLSGENVFLIRTGSAAELVRDACRFLVWVRRREIDAIVDGELFTRLTAVLCVLTGVRRRVGFHRFDGAGLYRGDLYSHPVAFDPGRHMAQNYLRLVDALLPPAVDAAPAPPETAEAPRIEPRNVSPAELYAVRGKLAARVGSLSSARLVLVNANASEMLPQRRWPPAHFAALIRDVLAEFGDVHVLLIGADEDAATTAAIAADVGDARCADVAGLFTLAELPALFSLSALLVSNDSGPAHFAAVSVLPVIALFGPETPSLFRPLGNAAVISAGLPCSPCVNAGNQRRTRCKDNQCMKRITVAQVFAAARAVLLAGGASRPPGFIDGRGAGAEA
ncbi:glycosyltransferase family 9 protein [Aromatoleum sp.]|uniref:glycosyltransferase family 9 protein n=1 Tax=Aromatoleum sp. TaxID=2307007 RepID=UPI002FCACF7C